MSGLYSRETIDKPLYVSLYKRAGYWWVRGPSVIVDGPYVSMLDAYQQGVIFQYGSNAVIWTGCPIQVSPSEPALR